MKWYIMRSGSNYHRVRFSKKVKIILKIITLKLWPMDEKSTLLLFKLFKNGISCSWHTKWRLSLLRLQNQFILYSCVHLKTRSDKNLRAVDLTFVYRRKSSLGWFGVPERSDLGDGYEVRVDEICWKFYRCFPVLLNSSIFLYLFCSK